MHSYSTILKTKGVARLFISQMVARFPFGMLPLVFLLHIELIFESYGSAGLVLACYSIGQAIAGPASSRLMGHFGMRPVLITTLTICVIAISVMTLPFLPFWSYLVVGFFAGITNPPIQPAVRTVYPKLVTSNQLSALFSLDASAQEIIWVVGPVVATFAAIQINPVFALILCLVLMVLGGIWFITSPELGIVRIPLSRRPMGAVLKKPQVLLATVIGFLLIGCCSAIEAGVVSVFGHDGIESGLILAVFSLGSLVAGLGLGHLPMSPWSMARRLLPILIGTVLAALMMNFWWLAGTLLIAGLGIAPALSVIFSMVASSVRFSETAEAYGWTGTGQLIGAALGSATAGFMIDEFGAQGAFWAAAMFIGGGALVAALTVKIQPDLRVTGVSPIPDTEPIQLPQEILLAESDQMSVQPETSSKTESATQSEADK